MAMEDAQPMLPGLWHWPPRWEEESQPSFNDLALVPFFAVMFPIVRYCLDRFVFEVRRQCESIVLLSVDYCFKWRRIVYGEEVCEDFVLCSVENGTEVHRRIFGGKFI